MPRARSKWKHKKKYKGKEFLSYYGSGIDRAFILISGKRKISFESWQEAVKQGWVKL